MPRNKRTAKLCFLQTLPGLEQVAWLEVRRRLPSAQFKADAYARNRYGVTLFTMMAELEALDELRLGEALYIGALWIPKLSRGHRDLRRVENELIQRGDLGRAVNLYSRRQRRQIGSYHVVAEKFGQHQYRLRDWSRAVRQAVSRLYPKWEGTQGPADVEIWAAVLGSQALIGLRLPQPDEEIPASPYPATLAAGLVELTEPAADDLFLDPLAVDGGMVLAERWQAGEATALWAGRGLIPTEEGALDHADSGHIWTAGRLSIAAGTVDKMASIIPSGVEENVVLTYLHEAARLLHPQGKLALFTYDYDRFLDLVRDEPRLQVSSGHSVLAAGTWGRIYVIEQAAE